MLTLPGIARRYCDGVSRRNFLRIGALGLGGLTLPQLLRAETASGLRSGRKAVIMIYLPGGPPHQDTFDLKSEAPAEIRGEFKPIPTNVSGIEICELLPRLAKLADRFALVRSLADSVDDHSDFMCQTGRRKGNQPPGGWPTLGACVSHVLGPADPAVPAFIGLEPRMQHRPYNAANAGYAGVSHDAFRPAADAKSDMVLNGITPERLADRRALLTAFDQFRRDVDSSGLMTGLDGFNQQAFGMLTSSKLLQALDLKNEDTKLLERYGKGDAKVHGDAAPMLNEQFLIARRLVEAGARFVTVAYGFWDYHGNNFGNARNDLPLLDQGVSALLEDLHERGLDRDVSVVMWSEFGRSPTINKDAGRDHWPRANCALLAGGGMKMGQVIGATDRLGGEPNERPVQFGEIFATLYYNLGLDVNKVTIPDLTGRPQYLVPDGCQPMKELVG
ncbi:MAG TPA: DUF1501 domain-containing protein [Verrucomicrobiota bacterium]|nr:DUF1501 domain-containing protein [Verrucomicrobiales bacterium]HRI15077.1 DUF1501 domain-containing protein [Verrucomicrobiota bacterium]